MIDDASSSTPQAEQTDKIAHEDLPGLGVSLSLLMLRIHESDRPTWVELVTILAQYCKPACCLFAVKLTLVAAPGAFRWLPELVVSLAGEDLDDELHKACVLCLMSLGKLGWFILPRAVYI